MSKDANARDQLPKIAAMIDEELPEGWGFMLFAFPFGDEQGRCNYIAKCRREDAVKIVREWLEKQAPEKWGKHEE
jgi:hypothetical protein